MAQTSRKQRHYQIVNILRHQDVHSQTVLRDMLAKQGIDVSQATLSRDLFQLQVMRTVDADGALTYRVPEQTGSRPGPPTTRSTVPPEPWIGCVAVSCCR